MLETLNGAEVLEGKKGKECKQVHLELFLKVYYTRK